LNLRSTGQHVFFVFGTTPEKNLRCRKPRVGRLVRQGRRLLQGQSGRGSRQSRQAREARPNGTEATGGSQTLKMSTFKLGSVAGFQQREFAPK
jgi:hypothetical protein